METSTPARPRITTLWGGLGIAISGAITLLASFHLVVPVLVGYGLSLSGVVPQLISSAVLLAAAAILAFGIRGESGIVGGSVVGKVALVVFGADHLLIDLRSLLPVDLTTDAIIVQTSASVAMDALGIAAVVIAAICVARADVLHGVARWVLVVVAAVDVVMTGVQYAPFIAIAYAFAVVNAYLVPVVLLIVLGVTYAVQGRSTAIRHRLQIINEKW